MTADPIGAARVAAERGEFESAIDILRPLAEAGNPEAQFHLGFLAMSECELISGREAFSLFMRAAEQGHSEAMYEVARFPESLSEPFTSPLSDEESWQWMLRAAEAGSHEAQFNVGAALATGDWADSGVSQDLEAAFAWYRRAADAGHIGAQFNLASMLAEGEGCDRDLAGPGRGWIEQSREATSTPTDYVLTLRVCKSSRSSSIRTSGMTCSHSSIGCRCGSATRKRIAPPRYGRAWYEERRTKLRSTRSADR